MKPARKCQWLQHSSHEIGFHQRRRKKIFAPGFPGTGIVYVSVEISPAALFKQPRQLFIATGSRVIECKRQTKRRIRMDSSADGIGLFGKKRHEPCRQGLCQRQEVPGPTLAIVVIPIMQLLGEFEKPCPTVSALK